MASHRVMTSSVAANVKIVPPKAGPHRAGDGHRYPEYSSLCTMPIFLSLLRNYPRDTHPGRGRFVTSEWCIVQRHDGRSNARMSGRDGRCAPEPCRVHGTVDIKI